MIKLLGLFPMLVSLSIFAQNGPTTPLGVRGNGIGNASIAFTDVNSIFNNQAGLANLEKAHILFSGQETFRAPNSDNMGLGFAIPTSTGAFGLNLQYYGVDNYNQFKIGIPYARKLMDNLSIGVQFNMVSSQILELPRRILISGEIGLHYGLAENFIIGIHFNNPAKLEIIKDGFLPNILRVGATYLVSKKLMFHTELKKDFSFPFIIRGGIECEVVPRLWLRTGFQHKPITYSIGTGYQFKNGIRFDFACFYQRGLAFTSSGIFGSSGWVQNIGLGFDFK